MLDRDGYRLRFFHGPGKSMKPGDWVGGKYRLGLELSRSEDWIRFAVEEPAQPQLELVLPMQHALLRPNVRDSFLAFKVPEHPAILATPRRRGAGRRALAGAAAQSGATESALVGV